MKNRTLVIPDWMQRVAARPGERVRSWDLALVALVFLGCYLSITMAEVALVVVFVALLLFRPRAVYEGIFSYPVRFWLWYGGFLLWSVLAVSMAVDWRRALWDARDGFLYLTPIVVMAVLRKYRDRAVRLLFWCILIGAAVNAGIGLYQFIWEYHFLIQRRIQGLQGHYITFSGLLMIALILLMADLEFRKPDWRWYGYLLFVGLGSVMAISLTRSVWLGTLVGLSVLGLLYGWRTFLKISLAILLIAAVAWWSAPQQVVNRVASFLKPSVRSNQVRLWMIRVGTRIMRDRPWFGIGPDNWQLVYFNYRLEEMPPDDMPVHFHNNFVQIAVERGVPALILWLGWYMSVLFALHQRFSRIQDPTQRWRIAGALAIWIALGVAGFFEYNFGDSEIQMLWLSLPALGAIDADVPR